MLINAWVKNGWNFFWFPVVVIDESKIVVVMLALCFSWMVEHRNMGRGTEE